MSDALHPRRQAAAPWDRKIPETVLEFYLSYARSFPVWRKICPHYIHPDVKAASELGYNSVLLRTALGEYVFMFSTKSTFIYEIEEEVRTGQLELRCNNELVLQLGISCADGDSSKPDWVARNVEVFCEGEWVDDLLQLSLKQKEHERHRLDTEENERRRHAQELTLLRRRFGGDEPQAPAAKKSGGSSASETWRRLRFWKKSGS